MIDLNNTFKKRVLGVTLAITAIAFVLSTTSKVLAQTAEAPADNTSIEVVSETPAAAEQASGHGLNRVIK